MGVVVASSTGGDFKVLPYFDASSHHLKSCFVTVSSEAIGGNDAGFLLGEMRQKGNTNDESLLAYFLARTGLDHHLLFGRSGVSSCYYFFLEF